MQIVADIASQRLLRSVTDRSPDARKTVFRGDIHKLELALLEDGIPVDPAALSVKLGIGLPTDTVPQEGKFRLGSGLDATPFFAYSDGFFPAETAVRDALNALPGIDAAGGVIVRSTRPGTYRIDFVNTGSQALISADGSFVPSGQVLANRIREGTADFEEIQEIQIVSGPFALATGFSEVSPAVEFSEVSPGVFSLRLPATTIEASITWGGNYAAKLGASSGQMQAALDAAEITATATRIDDRTWIINGDAVPEPTVTIRAAAVLQAELALNKVALTAALGSRPEIAARLEIEITRNDTGERITAVQAPISVARTVLDNPSVPAAVNGAIFMLRVDYDSDGDGIVDRAASLTSTGGPITGDAVRDTLDDHEARLEALEASDTGVESRLSDAEANIGVLQGETGMLAAEQNTQNSRLDALESSDADQDTLLTDHEGRLDTLDATAADHETRIDALEAGGGGTPPDLTALEARVTQAESDIGNLQADAMALGTQNAAQDATLTDHETRLDALEAGGGGGGTPPDLTALEARVTAAEGEIDSLQAGEAALSGEIVTHDVRINALETAVPNIDTRLTTAEGEVLVQDARIDTAEADIAALQAENVDHESRIVVLESSGGGGGGGLPAINAQIMALAPALYWPLQDATGATTAADVSGNGRNGIVEGGVAFGAAPAPVPGGFVRCARFSPGSGGSPSSQFAVVNRGRIQSGAYTPSSSEFSYVIWLRPDFVGPSFTPCMVCQRGGFASPLRRFSTHLSGDVLQGLSNSNHIYFNGSNPNWNTPTRRSLTTGQWFQIALVGGSRVYLNGDHIGDFNINPSGGQDPLPIALGATTAGPDFEEPWMGEMAHFAWFDRRLADWEVKKIYQAAL